MVQQLLVLLPKLPPDAARTVWIVGLMGATVGGFLWLIGAWVNRSIATLSLVAVGGVIGIQLPRWFGWPVHPWATATGAAIILGLLGFVLHRLWAAVALGLIMALWAVLALWITMAKGVSWNWPGLQIATTGPVLTEAARAVPSWLRAVWDQLPNAVRYWAPWAGGAAFAASIFASMLWKRMTLALLYSVLGATVALAAGLEVVQYAWPAWLGKIPPQDWAQAAILGGVVLLGLLIQYALTKPLPAAAPAASSNGGGDAPSPAAKEKKGK
jgi:hypothetical protein